MKTFICSFFLSLCATANASPEDATYRNFIVKVMDYNKVDFSETRKNILIDKIVAVGNKYLDTLEAREGFVVVLSIESAFKSDIKSSVAGAVGISQLMPEFFVEFAKECGLVVNAQDIYDPDVNLVVGACRFNTIMKTEKNPFIAVAAYNAGLHSPTVKKLKLGAKINKETDKYVKDYQKIISEVKK